MNTHGLSEDTIKEIINFLSKTALPRIIEANKENQLTTIELATKR